MTGLEKLQRQLDRAIDLLKCVSEDGLCTTPDLACPDGYDNPNPWDQFWKDIDKLIEEVESEG